MYQYGPTRYLPVSILNPLILAFMVSNILQFFVHRYIQTPIMQRILKYFNSDKDLLKMIEKNHTLLYDTVCIYYRGLGRQ